MLGVLIVLTHFQIIGQNPRGPHTWRQCHTLAVARNFHQESMNILRPRVDKRNDTSGVTGMQFPSYEYLVALGYKILGEHNFIHRILSLLLTFLACIAMYRIGIAIFRSEFVGIAGAAMLPWSPDLFYHSANALPDVLALTAGLWGVALAVQYRITRHISTIFWSGGLILLGALTKVQYLSFGLPILILFYQDRRRREIGKTEYRLFLELSSLVLMLTASWYIYARELRRTSGLLDFGLHFNPVSDFVEGLSILRQNLLSDLPELYLNYASFALMLVGLIHFVSRRWRNSEWSLVAIFWGSTLALYHILELGQMKDHAYYAMVYLLPLMLLAMNGVKVVADRLNKRIVWLLIAVMPVIAYARMHQRWTGDQKYVPLALYDNEERKNFVSQIPDGLCIVGPDISGSIYYYYLEREGFGFADQAELENEDHLKSMIDKGATILISDHAMVRVIPAVVKHTDSLITLQHDFYALRLK